MKRGGTIYDTSMNENHFSDGEGDLGRVETYSFLNHVLEMTIVHVITCSETSVFIICCNSSVVLRLTEWYTIWGELQSCNLTLNSECTCCVVSVDAD